MRLASFLVVFAALARAQSPGGVDSNRDLAVLRLNADLASLKTLSSSPDSAVSRARACLPTGKNGAQRPEECGPIDRITEDLSLAQNHHATFRALPLNLVNLLAGRDLEPEALSLFADSLVDAVVIADQSAASRIPVSRSVVFRESVIRAYTALLALGVHRNGAETFLMNFARNAERFPGPNEIGPIPPAPVPPRPVPRA